MAIPGNVGNYNPSAKRGAFARSPERPSSAKRGVFGASPSAAKKGIFAFTPGGGQSSAPRPTSFAPSPRQAEDYSMDLLQKRREQTRQDFFKGREDISPSRLDRRQIQDDLLRQYKDDLVRQGKYMKTASGEPVRTASGDYVYTGTSIFDTDSSSPTFGRYVTYGVTDKAKELANKYGPTFREIGSDMGYATKSIMGGIAKLPGQMLEAYRELSPMSKILQFVQGMVPGGSGTTAQAPMGLTPGQFNLYNNLIGNGMNPQMALEQAKRYVPEGNFPKSFAVGGIATLS